MCSGRVDLGFVLRAFSKGIDGVYIGGCHLGECNYVTHGNYHALNMVLLCKRLLEHIGLNPRRLRIRFMSGAEANVFAESVNDFSKTVHELGPIGKSEGIPEGELASRLEAVTKLIPYIKMVKREKLESRIENPEEYDSAFTKDEIDELFNQVISYYIDPAKCQACMICARRCPVDAIISAKNHVHVIDQDKCIKCGTCLQACPQRFGAVTQILGGPVPDPLPEDQRTIEKRKSNSAVA